MLAYEYNQYPKSPNGWIFLILLLLILMILGLLKS